MTPINTFFKTCAEQHVSIRHGQPVAVNATALRNSFFISSNAQIESVTDDAAYPCLVLHKHTGRLSYNSSVDDWRTGSFEVRNIVTEIGDQDEIDNVQEACKDIAFDIVAQMNQTALKSGNKGPLPGFDLSTVQYEFVGPYANSQYGVRIMFQYIAHAFSPYKSLTDVFIPAP